MTEISLTVNGKVHRLDVDAKTPLVYILRNDLGCKGVKLGCGLEQCGACLVLVDGKTEFSCSTPVAAFAGKAITTIEGIGTVDDLHPIQQAFVAERAAQCGYCIPGIIVATKALLAANPDPSDSQIREGLAQNLCRCGTHASILKAVKRAAREMRK
ncbi:MAG: (2Fe-2S)-binding protein [Rhodospirillales bacterium]|nr:(2Fe-2S)-binding protein [Rhodospirillales bacterium]